jgi:hypothetical protein
LALFQKNENMLAQALQTESFGEAVIESVMRAMAGNPSPPEAKPVEESAWERLGRGPLVPLAAAAILIVTLVAFVLFRTNNAGALSTAQLEDQKRAIEKLEAEFRVQKDLVVARYEEYERALREQAARTAIQNAGEGYMLAYVEPNHDTRVHASFDPKAFIAYSVYRRAETEKDESFLELSGPKRLRLPEFTDRPAACRPRRQGDECLGSSYK